MPCQGVCARGVQLRLARSLEPGSGGISVDGASATGHELAVLLECGSGPARVVCADDRYQRFYSDRRGAAALVKSAHSNLRPAPVRTILERAAQDIGKTGYDALFNFGLVDAVAAVQGAVK